MTYNNQFTANTHLKLSPFFERTSKLNEPQEWKRWGGYLAATSYELHHDNEYFAIRTKAALLDITPLKKYIIDGPDAQEFLDRLRNQLGVIWNDEIERIVQTMVYEDEDGQIQDILQPENHAQVIRAMWDEPASMTMPRIQCPTLVVPAGPTPERAGSEYAQTRRRMVDAAERCLKDARVYWVSDTIHDIGYHKPQELAQVIGDFLAER